MSPLSNPMRTIVRRCSGLIPGVVPAGGRAGRRALALGIAITAIGAASQLAASTPRGATVPWTAYEAEAMKTNAIVLGPRYDPYQVETESSGERCVKLSTPEDTLEFRATADGNAVVVRYSLPDSAAGGGTSGTLMLSINGTVARTLSLTSRYAHLYGKYPFANDPSQGEHRNFYDEVRAKDVAIHQGDTVRLTGFSGAPWCIVDLVDVERVAPPPAAPTGAVSIRDFDGKGDGRADDTAALRKAVEAAAHAGGVVWVPAGDYLLTGDIVVPSGVRIQGAGLWHTTFVGDAALYAQASRRVRFRLRGTRPALADFAIVGRLNYRSDAEPNDGVVGNECTGATIERIWIEHTKTGVWIYNGSQLTIAGCRFRDLIADGVNLCVGTTDTVVEDCTARGTGDDCFAIWPVPADQEFVQRSDPGRNVIRHCTGQLPFLANGGALYGGADNRIEDCRFEDITAGCGILISTTFLTSDEGRKIDNNFSGTTVVRDCDLIRCGGYDHDWAWRAALQFCLDRRRIPRVAIRGVTIRDSFSDGISVLAPGSAKGEGTLGPTTLDHVQVDGVGLGTKGRGLWIRADARGELTVTNSDLGEIVNDAREFTLTTDAK